MSTAIQRLLPFEFVTPLLEFALDCLSFFFAWLFFTGAYMLIPNTKVKFKNAFPAGAIAGTAFQALQWLFVTGQLYVSKYNAIYGSFSFLPLMLIWMQLSWLITLAGALICCSAQNISLFSFNRQIVNISENYRRKVSIAMLSVVVKRFAAGEKAMTPMEIAKQCNMPTRLAAVVVDRLLNCGLLVRIAPKGEQELSDDMPVQPALSIDHYTLSYVIRTLRDFGEDDFIPNFNAEFPRVIAACNKINDEIYQAEGNILLTDL